MTPDEMEAELDRIEARSWRRASASGRPRRLRGRGACRRRRIRNRGGARGPDPDDPFGRRAGAQAKLERVMALRASGDVVKARQLLYEVLVEGGEDQSSSPATSSASSTSPVEPNAGGQP